MGFIFINDSKKIGYYTYGKSCKTDNDCICVGVPGSFDDCGKVGQIPACVNGVCGWNTR